jgi:hypothetical protein
MRHAQPRQLNILPNRKMLALSQEEEELGGRRKQKSRYMAA